MALSFLTAILGLPLATWLAKKVWDYAYRPILKLDFGNRDPWRRHSVIVNQPSRTGSSAHVPVGLFYRVSVRNRGSSTATRVLGRLIALLDSQGRAVPGVDPLNLHWVGPERRDTIELRVDSETEFLDVFFIQWNAAELFDERNKPFTLYPAASTPFGLQLIHPVDGQIFRIVVSADNAASAGIDLRFMEDQSGTGFASQIRVAHRHFVPGGEFGEWTETEPDLTPGGFVVPPSSDRTRTTVD